MLFDTKKRADKDSKGHGETEWEYLDRSGRVEAERVRMLLTSWFSKYPEPHRTELLPRLKGGDDTEFQAAAFELLLYSALMAIGCTVEVHPSLADSAKHPDFLATTSHGEPVYVEARMASEFSREHKAAVRRTKVVLDAIEKVDSPDFFIGVSAEGNPATPPSGKLLRQALRTWIDSLDYESVTAASAAGHEDLPKTTWKHEGWKIEFDAFPKRPNRRSKGQRTVGALFSGARWGRAHEAIRTAVRGKGGRYGQLPHPLVIAVNVAAVSVDQDDEMNALFGDDQYVVRMGDHTAEPEARRAPNGAWFGKSGPRYTRVSGAWIFRNATPWNFTSRAHTVYFNPFATSPLPSVFDVLPNAKGIDGVMRWADGRALHDLFGLSKEWPE